MATGPLPVTAVTSATTAAGMGERFLKQSWPAPILTRGVSAPLSAEEGRVRAWGRSARRRGVAPVRAGPPELGLRGYVDIYHAARNCFDLSVRATRERVRVGRALRELPRIEQAFVDGRLGYSRARGPHAGRQSGAGPEQLDRSRHGGRAPGTGDGRCRPRPLLGRLGRKAGSRVPRCPTLVARGR